HQDKEDDALIGVKSSARRLGEKTKPALWLFFGAVIALFAVAGLLESFSAFYFIALAPAALHFTWQARSVDIDAPGSCLAIFKSNREAGLLLLAALLLEAALRSA
ncbi:MAG TPA: UbiA family prenyltransferase, partial [Amphiplicatus sp.]|nr:UbiA family prenyltransferase [Amphiplicatus sp.]